MPKPVYTFVRFFLGERIFGYNLGKEKAGSHTLFKSPYVETLPRIAQDNRPNLVGPNSSQNKMHRILVGYVVPAR